MGHAKKRNGSSIQWAWFSLAFLVTFAFCLSSDSPALGSENGFTRLLREEFSFTGGNWHSVVSPWDDEDEENYGEEYLSTEEPYEEEELPPVEDRFDAIVTDILTPTEVGYIRIGQIGTMPAGRIRVGKFVLFPVLEERIILDDNIFLQETSARTDVIFSTKLGLFSDLYFGGPDRKHTLRFGYKADIQEFSRTGKTDFIEQFAGASVNLDFHRIYVNASHRFERRYDPVAIQYFNLESSQKLDRTINTFNFVSGYKATDKLFFEFAYERMHERFGDSAFQFGDRVEPEYALLAGWKYMETLDLYFKGAYGERNYKHSTRSTAVPDSHNILAGFGMRGEPTDRMETRIFLGWRKDHYQREGTTTDTRRNNHDVEVEAGVAYRLEEDHILEAVYLRTSQFAGQATTSNFQILDHTSLTWTHHFNPQLTVRSGIFGEQARVSNAKDAYRWGIGAGLQYRLNEYIDINFDYTYRRRIAKAPGGDFVSNIASLGVSLKL